MSGHVRQNTHHSKFKAEKNASNPVQQLIDFYHFFPAQETAPDQLMKLYAAAASQSLNLDQGEYDFAHERDGKLDHYEITLPLKGSYLQIRKFIAQALTAVPSLALDSITLNRQRIDDAMVDAQVKMTLYLNPA